MRGILSTLKLASAWVLFLATSGVLTGCSGGGNPQASPPPGTFRVETVASGLDTPWDLAWGPDNVIWVTERPGFISRVDPATGRVTRVGQIPVTEQGESGLMGMAFHPDFSTQPFVYLSHSYSFGGGIRNRLIRMRYDGTALGSPETLLEDIPGSSIHDGSRLGVGPGGAVYLATSNRDGRGSPAANDDRILRVKI